MSIEQPMLTLEQIDELTLFINQFRIRHKANSLKWDDTIAKFSQEYSYYLVSNRLFQHSKNESYGENLAYFQGQGNDFMTLIKSSYEIWYNEVNLYNFKIPGYSPETSHFTCLVWNSSELFGIGYSYDPETNIAIIVLNTSPPGNVIGKFTENVFPMGSITFEPEPEPILEYPENIYMETMYKTKEIIYALYILSNNIIIRSRNRRFLYDIIQNIGLQLSGLNRKVVSNLDYIIQRMNHVNVEIRLLKRKKYILRLINNIITMLSAYT